MSFEDTLREKIRLRREEVRVLDGKIDELTVRRNGLARDANTYEDVLKDYLATLSNTPKVQSPVVSTEAEEDDDQETEGRPTRGLSSDWKAIMKRLSRKASFGYDDVVAVAAECGLEIEKPRARSRMFSYSEAGYVERVGEGIMRLTQRGREAAE